MTGLKPRSKRITAGTYMRRELIDLEKGRFDEEPRINRTNKLVGSTEIVLNLDELDYAENLETGKPGSTLLTYHVTAYGGFCAF